MSKFNVRRIEGVAILNREGDTYNTYKAFADAAGFPNAVVRGYEEHGEKQGILARARHETVQLLAKGNHGETGGFIYVAETSSGVQFLIGEDGLSEIDIHSIIDEETNVTDVIKELGTLTESANALIREAYLKGYEAGKRSE